MAILTDRGPCTALRDSLLSDQAGPPGSGHASLTDQWLALQANRTDRLPGSKAHSTAMAPPAHGRRRPRARPSGARKGRFMALTGTRSGRTGGRGGQLNAAPTSVILALTLALTLLLLAACGDDSSPTVAPTSSSTAVTTAASTTPTTADPAAEIVARYTQFWEARFEANRDPVNPADPRLAQLATGAQLDNVLAETRQRRDQGLAVRRPDPSASTQPGQGCRGHRRLRHPAGLRHQRRDHLSSRHWPGA